MSLTNSSLIFFSLLMFFSCTSDNHDHPELKTGQQFFEHHCIRCHGKSGQGDFIKGIPPTISSDKNIQQTVIHITNKDREDTSFFSFFIGMPSFKTMPEEEATIIAAYLLELKKNSKDVAFPWKRGD